MTSRVTRALFTATLIAGGLSVTAATADHCGDDTARANAHDPFGSCEETNGRVHCGSTGAASVEVPGLGRVTVGEQGMQLCADDDNSMGDPRGRVTVYNHNGYTGVAVDGDDSGSVAGQSTAGWYQVYRRPDGRVCLSNGVGNSWERNGPPYGVVCTP